MAVNAQSLPWRGEQPLLGQGPSPLLGRAPWGPVAKTPQGPGKTAWGAQAVTAPQGPGELLRCWCRREDGKGDCAGGCGWPRSETSCLSPLRLGPRLRSRNNGGEPGLCWGQDIGGLQLPAHQGLLLFPGPIQLWGRRAPSLARGLLHSDSRNKELPHPGLLPPPHSAPSCWAALGTVGLGRCCWHGCSLCSGPIPQPQLPSPAANTSSPPFRSAQGCRACLCNP